MELTRLGAVSLIAVAACVASLAQAETASTSPSYRLEPATLDAAGPQVASSAHVASASLAQPLAIGTSSSPHFVVQSGFWGFTGSGLVPVVLSANRTTGQPQSIDLAWSGNDAPYDLYRAESCATIYSSIYATTSNNAYTDASAPTSGLTCYSVLALAPGPVPPPPAAP